MSYTSPLICAARNNLPYYTSLGDLIDDSDPQVL